VSQVSEKAKQIRLVIFDVDGVLTDSRLYFGDNSVEYKTFNSKDGLGIKLLQETGVEVGIITGRRSNVVQLRTESLGIKHLYQGQTDKLPAYEKLKADLRLKDEQIAYAGDDFPDLPVMEKVGLSIAVLDAHPIVKDRADYTTAASGGTGAAREICELIMHAQDTFDGILSTYIPPFSK